MSMIAVPWPKLRSDDDFRWAVRLRGDSVVIARFGLKLQVWDTNHLFVNPGAASDQS